MDKVSLESFLDRVPVGNEERISCEGFFATLGEKLKDIMRGKLKPLSDDYHKTMLKRVKETYMDPNWLKTRKMITGEVTVPAQNYGELLTDIDKHISSYLSELKTVAGKNRATADRYARKAKPIMQGLLAGAWKDPAKCAALGDDFDPYPEVKYSDMKDAKYSQNPATVEALTQEGVIATAKKLLDIDAALDESDPFGGEWVSIFHPGGKDIIDTTHGSLYKEIKSHYSGKVPKEVDALMENINYFYSSVTEDYYQEISNIYVHGQVFFKALAGHIDASVK